MKRFFAAVLGLITGGMIAWADIPPYDQTRGKFLKSRRGAVYPGVAADSVMVNKIYVDSLIVDEYSEGVGIPYQSTEPNACPTSNANDARLWIDSDDEVLYKCGASDWEAVGLDADQDGFANDIDQDDTDATDRGDSDITADNIKDGETFWDGSSAEIEGTYATITQTSYTNPTMRSRDNDGSSVTGRIRITSSAQRQIAGLVYCAMRGHDIVVSSTSESQTNTIRINIDPTSPYTINARESTLTADYLSQVTCGDVTL